MSLLLISDQRTIKPISQNNENKFNDLLEMTLIKDIKPLLGYYFYQDIIQNPTSTANKTLLDGGTYTYSGVTYTFKGLKYVIAYFLYANYIFSNIADTFTGFVVKSNEDSQPASQGDKKNLRDINIEVAMQHWDDCKMFIMANSPDYPNFIYKQKNNRMIIL